MTPRCRASPAAASVRSSASPGNTATISSSARTAASPAASEHRREARLTGDPKAVCKAGCSTTDFFSCYQPGDLQACFDACDAATDAQIEQYVNCFSMTVECAALVDCEKNLP